MTDWRTMMQDSLSPAQYPQYPQKGSCPPSSEHFEDTHSQAGTVIQQACRPDRQPPSPIYWETGDGQILGPATPEFFLRDGEEFWISVTFEGQIRFVRDGQLRRKGQFERQRKLTVVEPIRWPIKKGGKP